MSFRAVEIQLNVLMVTSINETAKGKKAIPLTDGGGI
jgi:hypothetical protein